MSQSFKNRFESFVKTLDGFESIDSLLLHKDPEGKRRADYLFSKRSIIIEQKTLESDPAHKAQGYIDKLMADGNLVVYGQTTTTEIFQSRPDGNRLNKAVVERLTSVVESNLSAADKQARDTREIFSIPEAAGLVVILNQDAQTLTPDLILYRVCSLLKAKSPTGEKRFPENDVVVVISDLHSTQRGSSSLIPMLTIQNGDNPRVRRALVFADFLQTKWAEHTGIPLIKQS